MPSGVTAITVQAYGAAGGEGCYQEVGYPGGSGGEVVSTVTVSAGQIIYVNVGGSGSSTGNSGGFLIVSGGFNGKIEIQIMC